MRRRPVVTTCVAVVLALTGLAACGKGADQKTPAKPSSTASGLLPTDAPSTPSGPAATGPTLKGTGYTLNLPAGWIDITSQAKDNEPRIDAAGRAEKTTPPYTANLNVLTTKSSVTDDPPTRADLQALAKQTRQEILTVVPKVVTVGLTQVGGSPAVHQEGDAQYGNKPFYLVQYATIRGGANYILTFSFPSGVDEKDRSAVIDPVLKSFAFSA